MTDSATPEGQDDVTQLASQIADLCLSASFPVDRVEVLYVTAGVYQVQVGARGQELRDPEHFSA